MIFWTYIEKELSDLIPKFEEAFQGLRLSRDYENKWEWIHGDNINSEYFNISRTHNWKKGSYEALLFINIEAENEGNFDEIGHALKKSPFYNSQLWRHRNSLKWSQFKVSTYKAVLTWQPY